MNSALEEFVDNSENSYLIDVRKVITRPEQLRNNIRHYSRESYRELALLLLETLGERVSGSVQPTIPFRKMLLGKAQEYPVVSKALVKLMRFLNRKDKA